MKREYEKKAKEIFLNWLKAQKKEYFVKTFFEHCVVNIDEDDGYYAIRSKVMAMLKISRFEMDARIEQDKSKKKSSKK